MSNSAKMPGICRCSFERARIFGMKETRYSRREIVNHIGRSEPKTLRCCSSGSPEAIHKRSRESGNLKKRIVTFQY